MPKEPAASDKSSALFSSKCQEQKLFFSDGSKKVDPNVKSAVTVFKKKINVNTDHFSVDLHNEKNRGGLKGDAMVKPKMRMSCFTTEGKAAAGKEKDKNLLFQVINGSPHNGNKGKAQRQTEFKNNKRKSGLIPKDHLPKSSMSSLKEVKTTREKSGNSSFQSMCSPFLKRKTHNAELESSNATQLKSQLRDVQADDARLLASPSLQAEMFSAGLPGSVDEDKTKNCFLDEEEEKQIFKTMPSESNAKDKLAECELPSASTDAKSKLKVFQKKIKAAEIDQSEFAARPSSSGNFNQKPTFQQRKDLHGNFRIIFEGHIQSAFENKIDRILER